MSSPQHQDEDVNNGNEILVASLSHVTPNLGDEIQTIAADQFVDRIHARFDRDQLRNVKSEKKYLLILNGWFSHHPESCIPLAECFVPLIIGFHIAQKAKEYLLSPPSIAFFKRFAPIGCRDEQTMHWLREAGVDAYFSRCLTLTLPQRLEPPKQPKVVLVDISPRVQKLIPKTLSAHAVSMTHVLPENGNESIDRIETANAILQYYRDHAGLVITSRLHCALPCVAMGIPVIYFTEPTEYRVSVARSSGLKIYRPFLFAPNVKPRGGPIRGTLRKLIVGLDILILRVWYQYIHASMWRPAVVDVREIRSALINRVHQELRTAKRRLQALERNLI